MMPKVYIETSIIGYLASRPSRDLITAANQALTRDWWEHEKENFMRFVSTVVIDEISKGNKIEAKARQAYIKDCRTLLFQDEAAALGQTIVSNHFLPRKAIVDAIHISLAAIYEMDYLLTWNCKHIANATTKDKVTDFLVDNGYKKVVICTPQELHGV
jgi:hypothetical protein